MPRNEPLKDPVKHSERHVRGQVKPRDPIAESEAMTRHSRADWAKRLKAGELHGHEAAPAEEKP